jgi:hypothetical protein
MAEHSNEQTSIPSTKANVFADTPLQNQSKDLHDALSHLKPNLLSDKKEAVVYALLQSSSEGGLDLKAKIDIAQSTKNTEVLIPSQGLGIRGEPVNIAHVPPASEKGIQEIAQKMNNTQVLAQSIDQSEQKKINARSVS